MKRNQIWERSRPVTPQVVDQALQAFWRGSAQPIDRLAGVDGKDRLGVGELLLSLLDSAGTARSARTRARRDGRGEKVVSLT